MTDNDTLVITFCLPPSRPAHDDGPSLPPATVRRLCCDASLVAITEREDGTPPDLGRKTRAIPRAIAPRPRYPLRRERMDYGEAVGALRERTAVDRVH